MTIILQFLMILISFVVIIFLSLNKEFELFVFIIKKK